MNRTPIPIEKPPAYTVGMEASLLRHIDDNFPVSTRVLIAQVESLNIPGIDTPLHAHNALYTLKRTGRRSAAEAVGEAVLHTSRRIPHSHLRVSGNNKPSEKILKHGQIAIIAKPFTYQIQHNAITLGVGQKIIIFGEACSATGSKVTNAALARYAFSNVEIKQQDVELFAEFRVVHEQLAPLVQAI